MIGTRPEAIKMGPAVREPEIPEKNFASLLENVRSCGKIQLDLGLYGDGQAARKIAETLELGRVGTDWRPVGPGTEGYGNG